MELATLEWVAWFNHHRLLEPIGYIPPAEAEANYGQYPSTDTTEQFDAERPVEPFDVGVLCRAPGLSELPLDAVGCGPCLHDAAAKLWAIVTAHRVGFAVPPSQLLQHANDARVRQSG